MLDDALRASAVARLVADHGPRSSGSAAVSVRREQTWNIHVPSAPARQLGAIRARPSSTPLRCLRIVLCSLGELHRRLLLDIPVVRAQLHAPAPMPE